MQVLYLTYSHTYAGRERSSDPSSWMRYNREYAKKRERKEMASARERAGAINKKE
jgi:hypothetical protein